MLVEERQKRVRTDGEGREGWKIDRRIASACLPKLLTVRIWFLESRVRN